MSRVLLFVQTMAGSPTFPDGDDRVKCYGPTTSAPEGKRGDRFSLSFKTPSTTYGTNRQRKAMRDARRWWLVECKNAREGRTHIGEVTRGCIGQSTASRILDSGGKP